MDMQGYINAAETFARGSPIFAALIGIVLLILAIRKTKLFIGLLLLGLLLAGIFSMIRKVADEGGSVKSRMIDKSVLQENR